MANWNRTKLIGAISLILAAGLTYGCAGGDVTLAQTGGQTLPHEVTTEYLLATAGFKRLTVNNETPKLQALLNNIPAGKLVTYTRKGDVYYAYADEGSQTLYLGDPAANQRYEALARGRQLCVREPGTNPVEFWGCMQEHQERGPGR